MKRMKQFTSRMLAVMLAGTLAVGSLSVSAFGAEEAGSTVPAAEEFSLEEATENSAAEATATEEADGEVITESSSAEVVDGEGVTESPDAAFADTTQIAAEEEAVTSYTVTLDANGGYFTNEWDDSIGDYVEQAEAVVKQIPVGGTVTAVPVFTDPDGQGMSFAGWSLDANGDFLPQEQEGYAPVGDCVLYAVWKVEEAAIEEDTFEEVSDENDGPAETVQNTEIVGVEPGDIVDTEVEGEESVDTTDLDTEVVEETGDALGYEDIEPVEKTNTAQETIEDNEPAENIDISSQVEYDQEVVPVQEVAYSDEEEETRREAADVTIEVEEIQSELIESSGEEEVVREDDAKSVVESGTCGDNLTWTLDEEGTLTISGTGEMDSHPWLTDYKSAIKKVVIKTGVTSMDVYAFCLCPNLSSVIIPESITAIPKQAFASCESLTDIVIPSSINYIGPEAFRWCSHLVNVTIPIDLINIHYKAFWNTPWFNSLATSEGFTIINGVLYSYSGDGSNVSIPQGVTIIRTSAFNSCTSLTKVTMPETVTIIEDSAFRACSNLYSVTIPSSVTNIGSYAFYDCTNLKSVTVPSSVEVIGGNAFENCTSLETVEILEGVNSISSSAFKGCSGLLNVTIPKSVTRIGYAAFENCSNITNLVISDGITSIEEAAFRRCSALKNIIIPGSIENVGMYIFKDCTSLESITLQDGVKSIGYCSFYGCESLTNVSLPSTLTTIGNTSFGNCKSLRTITIPQNVNSIILEYANKNDIHSAFAGAEKLYEIKVDSRNTVYKSYDGCLYDAELKELLYCPEGKDSLSISPSTTSINLSAIKIGTGEGDITESTLKEIHFDTCSPSIPDNFLWSVHKITAYYNNFLGNWPSEKRQNYGGTITWVEKPLNLSDCAMTISPTSYTYDGTAKNPTVTIKYNGTNLTNNTDYAVAYSNNINVGTGTVTATGKGHFTGSISKTFTINKATPTLSFASSSVSKTTSDSAFTNTLTKTTDGAITFSSSNTSVATVNSSSGLVTIKGVGNTTITANAAAGTNYNAGSASYTINVVQKNERYLDASDIFSFANSHSHFGYSNYYISDKDFLQLSNYVRSIYKNDSDYANSVINNMQQLRNSSWEGSCYGMAVTTILDKINAIGFNENFDPTAKTMSEVHSPADNTSVKSAINYYFLAQRIPYLRLENVKSYDKEESDWRAGLKQLVSMAQEGTPILFCYWFARGGHAIVIKGYEKAADGGHNIIAYDNRYPNRDVVIYIDSNYSKCIVDENENAMCIEYVKNMSAFDAIDIDGAGNQYKSTYSESSINADSSSTQITVRSKGKITIENAEGQTLVIDNGTTSGTMEIANQYMIVGETENGDNNSGFTYLVSNSESFTFESDNGIIDASVVGSGFYGSAITSGADYVVISSKSGVYALGNDFSYALSLAVNNDMCDMVSIDGNANNDVKLLLQGSKVKATGIDTDSGIVTVYSNTVDTDTYSYLKGYKSIVIKPSGSGEAGDVDIMGSSKENGIYDTNIGIKGEAVNISSAVISGILNKTYNGKAQTQNLTVKMGTMTLKSGTDYTVSYKNNTNAGTATVSIAGKGNYKGTKAVTFKINKAAQSITAKAAASRIAVGKSTTVSITGNKGSKSFKSSDTTIATVDKSTGKVTAKKVGTVKITATSAATANYNAASKTVTIKVVPAATASLKADNQATGIKLTWKKVTGANGYKIYRGSTLIKTITSGNTVTFADTKANTNGTKYTYKVIAKAATGDSTLSKSVAVYRVSRPAVSSVTNSAASKMTVKWGKNAKATGYQIQYSTDKSFKTGNKAVTVASASAVSKVIGSLTKSKTYYVRIRTYKTVGSTKYWSVWSAAKSVKIAK